MLKIECKFNILIFLPLDFQPFTNIECCNKSLKDLINFIFLYEIQMKLEKQFQTFMNQGLKMEK
jgi:hypothetical protein